MRLWVATPDEARARPLAGASAVRQGDAGGAGFRCHERYAGDEGHGAHDDDEGHQPRAPWSADRRTWVEPGHQAPPGTGPFMPRPMASLPSPDISTQLRSYWTSTAAPQATHFSPLAPSMFQSTTMPLGSAHAGHSAVSSILAICNSTLRRPPRPTNVGRGWRFLVNVLVGHWITISTRRFCGSRTPSAVLTRRPASPRPITVIAVAGTPSRTSASLTVFARRSDSAML